MGETEVLIWVGAVMVIGINGFAAGIAAVLYIWRRRIRSGGRALLSAAAAGALPATMIAIIGLSEEGFSGEGPVIIALVFGLFLAVGLVLSLPGAIFVSRALDRPGDDHRAFE